MDKINIIHDSHNSDYRNPFGSIKRGQVLRLAIETNEKYIPYINIINFYNNRIETIMREVGFNYKNNLWIYEIHIDTKDLLGLNYYFFRININGENIFYGNNAESFGGIGQVYYNEPKSYQLTVHDVESIPRWYKEGIIYQIFVDRFCNGNKDGKILNPRKNTFIYGGWDDEPMYIKDTNGNVVRWDFYGGNLLGVKNKLQYIKSLGANIIYFNPIFESSSCHKYDTADYENIDRMFGTNDDFRELCEEANKIGIKIILDGVFSHTGADSKYFNKFGTFKDVGAFQSLESQYYRWYKFHDYPNYYESWWGFSNMPEVEELNSSYLDYIIRSEDSIVEKWLKLGASGWRLDVADELPDKFIKLLKQKLKQVKSDAILVGEVWEDASNKVSYSRKREFVFGQELDSVTNYPLRQIIIDYIRKYIDAEYFIRRYMSLLENYPKEIFFSTMNMLGNHDTERILTMVNNNIQQLKLVVALQMTLPGVPLIYYGDEAGLTGGKDPENRRAYPWGKENKEIFNYYKKLGNLRRNEETLKNGDISFKKSSNNLLCYERMTDEETLIVLINPSEIKDKYILNESGEKYINLLNSEEKYLLIDGSVEIAIEGNECKLLKKM